jgi:hypothetical protein
MAAGELSVWDKELLNEDEKKKKVSLVSCCD